MLKKLSAGAASLALAIGLTLMGVDTANAAPQSISERLCAIVDGEPTVECDVIAEPMEPKIGDTVSVDVTGVPGEYDFALYALSGEEVIKLSEDTTIIVDAQGHGQQDFVLPTDTNVAGGIWGILPIDAPDFIDDPDAFIIGAPLFVRAHIPALVQPVPGDGTEERPYEFQLLLGIPHDVIKVQALIEGEWLDFKAVSRERLDSDGNLLLKAVSPVVAKDGSYPVRLYNATSNVISEQVAELYIQAPPSQSPSPSPSPSPTSKPTPTAKPSPTQEPTAKPSPTRKPGKKPGLPRTGA